LISRHHQHRFYEKTVPNPSETLPKLTSLESSIREWPEANEKIGVSPDVSNTASSSGNADTNSRNPSTESGSTGGASVDTLDSQLQALENWSNDGMAKLSSSTSDNAVRVDVLHNRVRKFEEDTIRNMTKIFSTLESLSHDAAASQQQAGSNVAAQVQEFKNQINDIRNNQLPEAVSAASQRMDDVSRAIIAVDSRLGVVEKVTGVNQNRGAQSAESTEPLFEAQYLGFQFLIQSWTGRFAIGGVAFGFIALILSVVALVKIPSKPADDAGKGAEEEVLMEAGGEEEEQVEDPNAYDADPNAQYYEEAAAAEEQVQQ